MATMMLDERFADGLATLTLLRDELLAARETARGDPSTWGGWSVRFNQRLRGERQRLAILLEPPDTADVRLRPMYRAAMALRILWEAMNKAASGAPVDIAGHRLRFEQCLAEARAALERSSGD